MKRKITRTLLFILCTLLLLPIFSAGATEDGAIVKTDGGEFGFDKSTGTVLWCWPEGDGKTLVIPEKLDGVAVTAIGDNAFFDCDTLESVTLPNGLKRIGESAFEDCDALKSITVPDSVTDIGVYAFSNCYLLESVKLGQGLTAISDNMFSYSEALKEVILGSNITAIGERAFYWCVSLEKIDLPDSLKTIGNDAFYSCSNLATVTFGKNLETIGECAFRNCDALTNVSLPDSVKAIGSEAFSSSGITSITLGKELSSLGQDAFLYNSSLTSITVSPDNKYFSSDENGVLFNKDQSELICFPAGFEGTYTIAESVSHIANSAFRCCYGLTEVIFSANVKTIGDCAFDGCIGLTKLVLPDHIISIGDSAFYHCENLAQIHIGSGVESIGEEAFNDCRALASISVDATNKQYFSDAAGVLFGKENSELIQAPRTLCGTYAIPGGTKIIGKGAFLNSELTDVTIPASVEHIMEKAFSGAALKGVVIPEGVKQMDSRAFFECKSLESISLPDSLEYIGESTFLLTPYYATESNWTEGVLYIGNHLIDCESAEKDLVIREGTRTIAGYAFTYYSHEKIVLPESLVGIGEGAFFCAWLTEVTIPKNVAHIGENAFAENHRLTTITVDAANKNYCSDECGALYNKQKTVLLHLPCAYGSKYTIPDGVTTIANGALELNANLIQLTIPKSVTKIGEVHFYYDVYYTGSQADWQKLNIPEDFINGRVIFNYVPLDQIPETLPFKDVKKTDYFATAVLWASANKITAGVSATSFAPNDACTRAQIVTFLWRSKGSPEPTITDNPFKDIKPSDYYYKAILWAYESGIIYGMSENTFAPNAPCTRGQVATILYRVSNSNSFYDGSLVYPFTDVYLENYFYDSVIWAYKNGITDGVGGGKFAPNAVCTRAQIVTFLMRAMA